MSEMKFDNARTPQQIERMRILKETGACFFCEGNYIMVGGSPSIYIGNHWFVKKNDYPYEGAVHHYLVVPKEHIKRLPDISPAAWMELWDIFGSLIKRFKTSGESIFVRSGDMNYTGATLDHLHFHFLVGISKPENATIQDNNITVTLGHKNKDPESA
jgi:ATP adenylyltransferase